jgi:hypothetical protein
MAESVKIEGGGDGILIAGGIFIFFVIILLVVWAMNPDMFKKKEGDDCEVEDGDIRGTYKIDKDGKCVLKSCDTGWKVLGDKCTKILDDEVPGPADPVPKTKKYRYVRFAKTNDISVWGDRIINLGEVYVYDSSGTNVALGKTVMHDSTTTPFYKALGSNLVDGDDFSMATSGDDVKQDTNQPQKQWIQIDLGSEMEITSIKVIDRPGYPSRLNDVKIQLLDGSSKVVHTSPGLTTADAKKGIAHTYTPKSKAWVHTKGPDPTPGPTDPTPGPTDPTPGPADPCAGVTDQTPTASVSKECLKQTLIGYGCKPDSSLVTGITIDGGWGGGGGTFSGVKSDMNNWATLTTSQHRMACYGVSKLDGDPADPAPGPTDPCAGVGDDYLVGNIQSKCLRSIILNAGCVPEGSLAQKFEDDTTTGKRLGGAGKFSEFKNRINTYYVGSELGTSAREACYNTKGYDFHGTWIDPGAAMMQFPSKGDPEKSFGSKNTVIKTEPNKETGQQWRLQWVVEADRSNLLWLDSSGSEKWSLVDTVQKRAEMGELEAINLTPDGNICAKKLGETRYHCAGTNNSSDHHMLVAKKNGELYVQHSDGTKSYLYRP